MKKKEFVFEEISKFRIFLIFLEITSQNLFISLYISIVSQETSRRQSTPFCRFVKGRSGQEDLQRK
jgi:hypothetical protein